MYSRYLPDGRGGYRRQPHRPEPPHPHMPQREPEPPPPPAPQLPRPTAPPQNRRPMRQPTAPTRAGPMGRPPPGSFPGGGHGALLRDLDAEDLLILAVLLLAMREDGASGMELMIAAGLYLVLGK